MTNLKISIIIPTHNSASTIQRCVRSLTSQSFPREQFEIIVVDDGSKDDSTTLAKEAGADKIIVTKPCPLGEARNIAVQSAKADLLACIDSDCEAEDGWVSAIVKEMKNLQAIGGRAKNGNPQSLIAWAEFLVEFCCLNENKKLSPILSLCGCNLAFTKFVFNKVGGFPEERLSEDVIFSERLKDIGITLMFIPEMSVRHLCRTKFKQVSSNMRMLGRYYVRNRRIIPSLQHGSLVNSRLLIPIGFLRRLGSSFLGSIRGKLFGKFLLLFPLVLILSIYFSVGIWEEQKNPNKKK